MCESCIDRLFTLGPEPCPRCGRILRKVNFAHQTFEDLKVEKEVAVRRRMAEQSVTDSSDPSPRHWVVDAQSFPLTFKRSFNKRRDDFRSEREYDDYLEEVEDLSATLLIPFVIAYVLTEIQPLIC